MIPIIVGALETKGSEDQKNNKDHAALKSVTILRRVLEAREDVPSLRLK